MKIFLSLSIAFAFYTHAYSQSELTIYGSLSKVMQENDTSEKVRLNLMGPIFNYYGLGAVAGLDGEIMIINGETYVTRVFDGSLATDKSTDVGAALLVMTPVESWDTLSLESDISSISEIDDYLKGLNMDSPFPFMILTSKGEVRWHVISPPRNLEESNDHKNLGVNGKYSGEALILGFYSKSHHGVFTHHGKDTHIHFQSADKLYAGHVDELIVSKDDILLIPKY